LLPAGPDAQAETWLPPGERKDQPPRRVSLKIRRDARQTALDLEGGE
jgi:hypothetical protein